MSSKPSITELQSRVCTEHGAAWVAAPGGAIAGVASDVRIGSWPVNGLRYPVEGGTSGWYLWAGEGGPNQADDYFQPVHISHLADRCPEVLSYLGLPPGWRFLIAPGYADAWEDPTLLEE